MTAAANGKRTVLQARIAIAILSLNALALSKNVISLIIADLIKTYPTYPVSTIQLIFSTTTGMAVIGSLMCIWLVKRMTLKSISVPGSPPSPRFLVIPLS